MKRNKDKRRVPNGTQQRLGDLLQGAGLVTSSQVTETLENKDSNQKLGESCSNVDLSRNVN